MREICLHNWNMYQQMSNTEILSSKFFSSLIFFYLDCPPTSCIPLPLFWTVFRRSVFSDFGQTSCECSQENENKYSIQEINESPSTRESLNWDCKVFKSFFFPQSVYKAVKRHKASILLFLCYMYIYLI